MLGAGGTLKCAGQRKDRAGLNLSTEGRAGAETESTVLFQETSNHPV